MTERVEDGPGNSVDRESLGRRLREARKAERLTIRDVAAAVGVSVGTWSATENGLTRITEARLTAAARLFGLDRDELLQSAAPDRDNAISWRYFPSLQLAAPLHGALEAFVELGYHGATIRDVALRADLSVAGIYHHWPTKQDLLIALLDLTMADLQERCRVARAEGDGPVQRLTLLVECLALFHTYRRELGFLGSSEMRSLEEPHRSRIVRARRDVQDMVDDEVLEGCRRGLMDTPVPREAARAIVTLCTALPQWWSPSGGMSPETTALQYTEFASDLVRVRRRREPQA